MGYWPIVLNVLKNSDVVLLLVDARMPEIARNENIIRKIEGIRQKRLVVVFNKIDLVGAKGLGELRAKYSDAFFVSAKKRTGVRDLKKFLDDMAERWYQPSLRVGIVGYPNIGKSTLINLLAKEARAKVSSVSGTTKKTQWARTGRLRIMDSPGVIPFSDSKVQVGMTASKDPHKLKNPEGVALRIIEFLMKRDVGVLKRNYGVAVGNGQCSGEAMRGKDSYEIFEDVGRKMGYLIKGGEIDENRTAIKIIDDWQKGRIKLK